MNTTPARPILFPHTAIASADLEALLSVFGNIRLQRAADTDLPPHLRRAVADGRLTLEVPQAEDGVDIPRLAADYRQWLATNRGAETRVRHRHRGTPPMIDDTSVARIRTQIMAAREKPITQEKDDSRHLAQIFLMAAEAWTRENAALQAEMDAHARKERELFAQLHGDPSELAVFPRMTRVSAPIDPCAQMTPEWLSSWSRLVIAQPDISGLWITLSDAVVEWMREVFENTRHLARISPWCPRGYGCRGGYRRQPEKIRCRRGGERRSPGCGGPW
jgi:hypothetical protein